MDYETSIPFSGDADNALETGTTVLISNGFRIESKDERSIEFVGPGMRSTRQNPLLGASRIAIATRGETLALEAEMGSVQRLGILLALFPLALAAALAIVFVILFRDRMGLGFCLGVSFGPTAPWIVLGPLIARWSQARTKRALQDLLENMAASGKSS